MNKLLLLFLFFVLFSCTEGDMEEIESGKIEETEAGAENIVTSISGRQWPTLDQTVLSYCGPGWGLKFCFFLTEHDKTVWTVADDYKSDFSDIKFSKFSYDNYFLSFFNLDTITSYCEGWKLGETTYDGIKSNIKIIKDEWDVLWIRYDYYGSSEEIEYTIIYKYEVIDGLLHFSSNDGQTYIFKPSERTYSEDFLDTSVIIRLEGCMF